MQGGTGYGLESLFERILHMSLMASFVILLVMLTRVALRSGVQDGKVGQNLLPGQEAHLTENLPENTVNQQGKIKPSQKAAVSEHSENLSDEDWTTL